MANYGLPYMGSKAGIVKEVISLFPRAEHFYDLFGGGFSVTHAMLVHRSKHYKEFHFNEIRPGICELIQKAIAGEYNYDRFKPRWISREEFIRLKDVDPYVKLCWSFGNNGRAYLFGKDIEDYKRSLHQAIIFNEFDYTAKRVLGMDKFKDGFSIESKRLFLRSRINHIETRKSRGALEQLERLQQLQQLQQLARLHFYTGSYDSVPIKPNSVIYCDIPYKGTADYGSTFNHHKFFDWADAQNEPVFISEYNVPDTRFKCIATILKRSMLNNDKSKGVDKQEKVYVNRVGAQRIFSHSS